MEGELLYPSLPCLPSVTRLSGKDHSAFKSRCAAIGSQNGMESENKTTVSNQYISLSDEDALLVKQRDQVNLKK